MAKPLKKISANRRGVKLRGKVPAARERAAVPVRKAPTLQILTQAGAAGDFSRWKELLSLGQRFTAKFMALLPVVLEDKDPGAVRKMRIVVRRLELMVNLIYGKPSPTYARKLQGRIKHCRRVLSKLADCDVLLKIAEGSLAKNPAQDAAAWQSVVQFLQKRRAKVLPRSLAKVRRIKFSSPCSNLQRDFQQNGAGKCVFYNGKFREATPDEADKIVQHRILRALTRLWSDFESLVEEGRRNPRKQVIHGIRIATKRLRHLIEVMNKLDAPGSREVLVRLRELQRAIGEWHDMEVLEHVTSDLLAQKKFVRDHLGLAVEIEELFLRNREIKRSSEGKFRILMPNSPDYQQIKSWVVDNMPEMKVHSSRGVPTPSISNAVAGRKRN